MHTCVHTPAALRLLSSAGADTHQSVPSGGFWQVSWQPLSSPPDTLGCVCEAPPPRHLEDFSIKCLSLPARPCRCPRQKRRVAWWVGGIRRRVTGLQAKMLSCCWCEIHSCPLRLPGGIKGVAPVPECGNQQHLSCVQNVVERCGNLALVARLFHKLLLSWEEKQQLPPIRTSSNVISHPYWKSDWLHLGHAHTGRAVGGVSVVWVGP